MKRTIVAFVGTIALVGLTSVAPADVLEVPANGGDASGIGYFSGWKCPPNSNITIVLDGGAPLPVPSGVRRGDTAGVCGNSGFNGYISQFNFNLLGDGNHTASVRQNGVQFAQATFHVTTFGVSFLSGASGTYLLQNFPNVGQTTTVEWSQGAQNFIIVGTGGGGGSAQVRYRNELTCDSFDFTSTMSANGFTWVSFTDFTTAYQAVNRTSLGPFFETNNTLCGDLTYNATLPIMAGRRYLLRQTFSGGIPVLLLTNEGASMTADELASGAADAQVERDELTPDVMIPGVVTGGTGTFAVSPAAE